MLGNHGGEGLVKLLWIGAPIFQLRVEDLPYMGAMRCILDRAPIATPQYATHRSPFIADFDRRC